MAAAAVGAMLVWEGGGLAGFRVEEVPWTEMASRTEEKSSCRQEDGTGTGARAANTSARSSGRLGRVVRRGRGGVLLG